MKKIQFLLLLIPLIVVSGFVNAQKTEITGKVTDQVTQEPLSGASILQEKKTKGVATKADGTFSIQVDAGSKTLIVSYVGYTTQILKIDAKQKVINIELVPNVNLQNEVVVIGYGTQKKGNITGAVSKFKNERLDESPVSRLDQALQGKIAGVQVQNVSSESGAAPKIRIRGVSSINAGADPLVVVDGQPVPDGLAFVNMGDVESVEVLKDAASAAIYGSRGASGVILITTKSGVAEKPKYNFKYSIGQKKDYKRYSIMTTSEYVQLLYAEAAVKGTDPSIPVPTGSNIASNGDKAAYIVEKDMRDGKGTDWQSESLKPGMFQNVQLSVSGGKKDVRYFLSGGYQKDEGLMFKSNSERFNMRAKVDLEFSKKIKLTLNVNPSYSKRENPSENFTNFFRYPSWLPVYLNDKTAAQVNKNPQYAALKPGDFAHPRHFTGLPYSGIMPDGSTFSVVSADPFGSAQNNPKASVLMQSNKTTDYRLQSSADLTITILPGLNFKSLASSYINYSDGLNFANRNATADGVANKGVYSNGSFIDLLSENTFTYIKNVKKNSFNVLAGFTAQKTNVSRSQVTGLDYPSDNITTLNNASQIDKAGTFGTRNQIGLMSYLSRLNYAYDNKYLLSASFRADGSSYFAKGNKWGSFPSISAGWVLSEEKLLQNIKWLDKLKVRASYGVTGNNRIQDFAFLDLLYSANYPFGAGTGNSTSGQVTSSTISGNPDITWESTFQNNYGVDISILKNKINLSVDAYVSKTDKLLLQQSAMAFTGVPQFWNNIGSLQNKGFEIDLNTKNYTGKNFKWSTSFNLSHTENSIIELGKEAYLLNQGERTELYQNKVGDPLVQFFGYKTDGVWLSQAQIDEARAKGLTSNLSSLFTPGGLKLVDINNDNIIDNNDRTVIGSPYPDFTWGITNTLSYKLFDLSFTIQGVQGGQLINGDPNYNEARRTNRAYNANRWLSPMFPGDGKTPYSTIGYTNWLLTDYVVEDASYQALRELIVGFTIPKNLTKKIGLNNTRIYMSAQNPYFKSAKGYRGINTESRFSNGSYSSSLIDGYQRGGFPMPKTYLFGVDFNF